MRAHKLDGYGRMTACATDNYEFASAVAFSFSLFIEI